MGHLQEFNRAGRERVALILVARQRLLAPVVFEVVVEVAASICGDSSARVNHAEIHCIQLALA